MTAVALLILETRNDWVRFHAFQSLLLTAVLLLLHVFFLWSSFLSWFLFLVDVALFWWLAYVFLPPLFHLTRDPRADPSHSWRAFHDAELLKRWHIPTLGDLAARWVEEE
jgi:hypothetical protein